MPDPLERAREVLRDAEYMLRYHREQVETATAQLDRIRPQPDGPAKRFAIEALERQLAALGEVIADAEKRVLERRQFSASLRTSPTLQDRRAPRTPDEDRESLSARVALATALR